MCLVGILKEMKHSYFMEFLSFFPPKKSRKTTTLVVEKITGFFHIFACVEDLKYMHIYTVDSA